MNTDCRLCEKLDIATGKDKLLFEDGDCYIVENGNTHLKSGEGIKFAKRRISLIHKKHISTPLDSEEIEIENKLANFMQNTLGIDKSNYFIKKTMGTYPEHFHIHAYVPPFSDEGKII